MPKKKEAGAEHGDGFPGRDVMPALCRLGDKGWGVTLRPNFTTGEKSAEPFGYVGEGNQLETMPKQPAFSCQAQQSPGKVIPPKGLCYKEIAPQCLKDMQ